MAGASRPRAVRPDGKEHGIHVGRTEILTESASGDLHERVYEYAVPVPIRLVVPRTITEADLCGL